MHALTTGLARHQALLLPGAHPLLTRLEALLTGANSLLAWLEALLAGAKPLLAWLQALLTWLEPLLAGAQAELRVKLLSRTQALLNAGAHGRTALYLVIDRARALLEVLQVLLLQSCRKRPSARRHGDWRKEGAPGTDARTSQTIPAINDGPCGDASSKSDGRSHIRIDAVAAIGLQHDDGTLGPHHIRRRRNPVWCGRDVFRQGQEVMRILDVNRRRRRAPPTWRRRQINRLDRRLDRGEIARTVAREIRRLVQRRRQDIILDRVKARRGRSRRLQSSKTRTGSRRIRALGISIKVRPVGRR